MKFAFGQIFTCLFAFFSRFRIISPTFSIHAAFLSRRLWNWRRRFMKQLSKINPAWQPLLIFLKVYRAVCNKKHRLRYRVPQSVFNGGRGERIWTSGFYVPNVALYQAEPHLDISLEYSRPFWQRYQDLNPDKQSQSLLCYHYTIPLSVSLSFFRFVCFRRTT